MTKGLARSLSRGPALQQPIRKAYVEIDAEVAITGATGVGWGTLSLGEFPEGFVLLLGASISVVLDGTGEANLVNAWDGDISVGTSATADGTLSGGEINLIPSMAVKAAAGTKATPFTSAMSAAALAGTILNNTDEGLTANLNIAIDDADISGNSTVRVSGGAWFLYSIMGDD